jgi:protein TonB
MARQISRSTIVRRPGAAALAVAVTFGLFYVMQALSAVHEVGIEEPPGHPPIIELGFTPEDSLVEPKVRTPVRQTAEPTPPSSSRIERTSFRGQEPIFEVNPLPPTDDTRPGGSTGDSPPVRAFCPSPIYPVRAASRGLGGWVHVEFDVNRAGSVENARVIDSDPPRVFDGTALKAASRCRFLPQKVDGKAVASFDIALVFSFDPSEQEEIR